MAKFQNAQTNMNQAKIQSVNSVMRNKRLSSLINDALGSPLGSSKREHASSTLRSLLMANSNRISMDGRGGPGPTRSFTLPQNQSPINPSASTDALTEIAQTEQPEQDNKLDMAAQQSKQLQEMRETQETALSTPTMIFKSPPEPKPKKEEPSIDPFDFSDVKNIITTDPSVPLPDEQSEEGDTYMTETPTGPDDFNDNASFWQEDMQDVLNTDQGFYDQWYTSLSKEEQDKWRTLYESVKAGIGSSAFAYKVMSDKEELKKLPFFKNVPDEALPVGASLTRQIIDLNKRLKEEHELKRMEDKINQMTRTGATVKQTLESYVRGRDQYLSKIDDMIIKAGDAMNNMDLANPHVNKEMQQYMDYLSILKGRQNQRYAGFVDTATSEYNAQLKALSDQYETTNNRYLEEFKMLSAVKEEDYNRLNTMLTDLYDNLANQETKEIETQMLKMEKQNMALENLSLTSDIYSSGNVTEDYYENKEYYQELIGRQVNEFVVSAGASGGEASIGEDVTPLNVNINEIMQEAQNNDRSPQNIIRAYTEDMSRQGKIAGANGRFTGLMSEYIPLIQNYLAGDFHTDEQKRMNVSNMIGTLVDNLSYGLSQYIGTGDDEEVSPGMDAIRQAIDDLTGIFGEQDDKEEWIADHSENVSEDILSTLWDYAEVSKKQSDGGYENKREPFLYYKEDGQYDDIEDVPVEKLKNRILGAMTGSIWDSFNILQEELSSGS